MTDSWDGTTNESPGPCEKSFAEEGVAHIQLSPKLKLILGPFYTNFCTWKILAVNDLYF